MEETYEGKIKLPMGKKDFKLVIARNGDGTFEGEFTVLGLHRAGHQRQNRRRGQLFWRVRHHHHPGHAGSNDRRPRARRPDRRRGEVPYRRASAEVDGALVRDPSAVEPENRCKPTRNIEGRHGR